jgi:hypothetical protein
MLTLILQQFQIYEQTRKNLYFQVWASSVDTAMDNRTRVIGDVYTI